MCADEHARTGKGFPWLYIHYCSKKYCLLNRSTCRGFYPWPKQPQQQYDENVDRVALQRRYPADDRWVVPHDLHMAMFSPATINVLPFDPHRNLDQTTLYASKYVSKPEKWFKLDVAPWGGNKVKQFLQARTVGLCQAINRLLNFHVVRTTRTVNFIPTEFIPSASGRGLRDQAHLEKHPDYPDPACYMNFTQQYFLRHGDLLHLRIEQFNRYFYLGREGRAGEASAVREDTREDEEARDDHLVRVDNHHRHHDHAAQTLMPGKVFHSRSKFGDKAVRRKNGSLAVPRVAFLEPIGDRREKFYEQRLLLALAWHAPDLMPTASAAPDGKAQYVWRLVSLPPPELPGAASIELLLGDHLPISMETKCHEIETLYSSQFACDCCAQRFAFVCAGCKHSIGFHQCVNPDNAGTFWRKGTLFGGKMDVEAVLYRLSKKGMPLNSKNGLAVDNLRAKAAEYVSDGHLSEAQMHSLIKHIEAERNVRREVNEDILQEPDLAAPRIDNAASGAMPLTRAQLEAKLQEMEKNMQLDAPPGEEADQWRIYKHIIQHLENGPYLRLMVQASAGTGKSYLLTAVCIWCLLRRMTFKVGAPTGIAASNIEVPGTDVFATTIHTLFDMDADFKTRPRHSWQG